MVHLMDMKCFSLWQPAMKKPDVCLFLTLMTQSQQEHLVERISCCEVCKYVCSERPVVLLLVVIIQHKTEVVYYKTFANSFCLH